MLSCLLPNKLVPDAAEAPPKGFEEGALELGLDVSAAFGCPKILLVPALAAVAKRFDGATVEAEVWVEL